MKILNTQQTRDWDSYTIDNEPILSIDLMERAAQQLFKWVAEHYSREDSFVIFAGSGNNGGDALALARLLYNGGYLSLRVIILRISSKCSNDCSINLKRIKALKKVDVYTCKKGDEFTEIGHDEIVIEGIFGSGLTRSVTGYWGNYIQHINNCSSEIISIDIPSGIFGDDNSNNNGAKIKADLTLTFQFSKLSSFFVDNHDYFGKWFVLDIGLHAGYLSIVDANLFLIKESDVKNLIKSRKTFDHKGIYGHAFLIAGSYQKMGAAVLAAKACLRSGVGLATVHVPESGREIIQTAVPEAMVCIDETEMNYCREKMLESYTAVGIGPGIGKKKSMKNALKKLFETNTKPVVIDADALNILSENKDWLRLINENAVLTPHPGEFDRLTKKHKTSYERYEKQIEFSKKYNVVVVLKGAYTSISDSLGNVYFNSTGNPGMATAGSGDVLTGIILSLLAQGYKPVDAAKIGVFLHGMAGDFAEKENGQEALIASDIIKHLGKTFKTILDI